MPPAESTSAQGIIEVYISRRPQPMESSAVRPSRRGQDFSQSSTGRAGITASSCRTATHWKGIIPLDFAAVALEAGIRFPRC